jgi:hypothetical protein
MEFSSLGIRCPIAVGVLPICPSIKVIFLKIFSLKKLAEEKPNCIKPFDNIHTIIHEK